MSQHGQRCGPNRARDTKDHLVVDDQEEIADSDTQHQLDTWDELFEHTVHVRNDSGILDGLKVDTNWDIFPLPYLSVAESVPGLGSRSRSRVCRKRQRIMHVNRLIKALNS